MAPAAASSATARQLFFLQNPKRDTLRNPFAHCAGNPLKSCLISSPTLDRRHLHGPLAVASASPKDSSFPFIDLQEDKPREECGIVGIIGDPDAPYLCSVALHALQHRGQEGAGIVSTYRTNDGGPASLRSVTGLGLVSHVFEDKSKFNYLSGSAAIGHVRYSTAGAASSLANVQPFLAGYRFGQLAVAHNGNLVNYSSLRARLEDSGSIFNTSSDTEVVLHLIANSKSRPLVSRIVEACESLQGAYSLLFLTENKLFAVRDPHGFRPLVLGRLRRPGRAVVLASETCALDLIEADYEREVNPGEVIVVDGRDMSLTTLCLMPPKPRKACIFEHIYFALPNSVVFGRAVYSSRFSFGATLAEESPVPSADVVIPSLTPASMLPLALRRIPVCHFSKGLSALITWAGPSFSRSRTYEILL
ncbi:hypothetical protein HPP92_024876 [Vanilla planifolia]|uniref:Glutamine amidotransferase type-2 domain-containing protein n=1 Tax=Vanilla planifolia TaxID=51239 RepID=A0A835PL51_VANPL|nr:hypothetical protein HPP92_024876 [Vanilla planifolia]